MPELNKARKISKTTHSSRMAHNLSMPFAGIYNELHFNAYNSNFKLTAGKMLAHFTVAVLKLHYNHATCFSVCLA
jgi:hypothetical protein